MSPLYDQALTCAAGLHRDQLRKNTRVAYVADLVAVSALVLEDGGTETEAIAGLLHDAVEDCRAQVEPILRQRFGDDVVDIVVECSDAAPVDGEPKPPWSRRKQAYVDHLRTEASESALRVSPADKLHNARATLTDLRESEPRGELAQVVRELYAQTGLGVEQPARAQPLVPACTAPTCTPAELP